MRFERPAFRDVLGNAGKAKDFAAVVVDGESARPNRALAAVWPHDPVFDIKRDDRTLGSDHSKRALPVIRVHGVAEGSRLGIQAFATSPKNAFVGGTHIQELHHVRIGEKEHLLDRFRDLAKARLALDQLGGALSQGLLGYPMLR